VPASSKWLDTLEQVDEKLANLSESIEDHKQRQEKQPGTLKGSKAESDQINPVTSEIATSSLPEVRPVLASIRPLPREKYADEKDVDDNLSEKNNSDEHNANINSNSTDNANESRAGNKDDGNETDKSTVDKSDVTDANSTVAGRSAADKVASHEELEADEFFWSSHAATDGQH